MWFFNNKTLLERLNDQTISDDKKAKLFKRGKFRLGLEIKSLSTEDLLKYLYKSNLSEDVKDLLYKELVDISKGIFSEEKAKFKKLKDVFSEKYAKEGLLGSKYCINNFKEIIIDRVFDKDIFTVISKESISTFKKKIIIDVKVTEYDVEKLLEYPLSNELIDYIIHTKLNDPWPIKNCLNDENISRDIKNKIIDDCITAENIFQVQHGVYKDKTIDLFEQRKELVEENFNRADSSNILDYFTEYTIPDEFKNRLYFHKFDEIKQAILMADKKKLKSVLGSSYSKTLNGFLFDTRKDVCFEIVCELGKYELLSYLNRKAIPSEFKRLIMQEHKDRILEEIKELSYRDLDLYYLTFDSSLPKEIQQLMLNVHYDVIVKNIMELSEDKLDTEIKYANTSPEVLKLMLKLRYDDKMTFKLLSDISIHSRAVDLVLDAKSDLLTSYVKNLAVDDVFTLKDLKVVPEIKDRIILQNKDYILSIIDKLDSNKKFEILNNEKVGGAAKQLLLGNFGIDGLDINECLTLLTRGNAEVLINNFHDIKNYVLESGINFKSLLQYGAGSKKHADWLEHLANIVVGEDKDSFIKCKDYFFSNYYVDLSERENAVYIIDSFLELVDSYIKYKDLMISMTNSNKVLTEKDKMNLKFLFKVSVPEGIEVPKTLEELSEFKLKLYSDYIDKINNSLLGEQELKNIFNDLLFCDSKTILDSIGGTGALRTLKKDNINNKEISSLIDEVILYGRVIEMVNDSNNVSGLKKVLKHVFSDIETLTKFQNLFSDFEDKVSKLYEMDSSYNLTSLDYARSIDAIDYDLSGQYGGEVFNFSDKNYVLYAHVLSRSEDVKDIVNGVASGDKNFISVSPISYRGQTYYWGRDEVIFAYNKIPNGSFVRSSISNMGSNGYISKNSSEVKIGNIPQRGILECSSTTRNNAEALLYREGLKPCGLILPGGRMPTNVELAIHEEYGLPFIVTQEVCKSIEDVKCVFNTEVVGESKNVSLNRELEEIIGLLTPNISISKEDDVYTGREVAIFTDCHSMFEPTIAVLDDIRRHGITEIYSLGDNVGLGPNPCEVFDLLEEYGVVSVAGNSEYYNTLGIEPFDYFYEAKKNSQDWTEAKLGRERVKKMEVYPASIDLVLGGEKLALCHFANDVRWDFHEHSTHTYQAMYDTGRGAEQFLYTNSDQCKKKINNCITSHKKGDKRARGYISAKENPLFDGKMVTDYDAIIQGHVHFDREDEIEGTTIHTLRACGIGYEKDGDNTACYYVFKEKKDGSFDKEKRLVKFNKNNLMSSIYSSDLPNKDAVLRYVKK